MMRPFRSLLQSSRLYSTSPTPPKVPISLISSLRALRPGTPLSLARTALQSSEPPLSLESALSWIEAQAIANGEAKAAKLSSREAKEGLVGVAVLNDGSAGNGAVRMAVVELSCETDFVGRTDEFRETVISLANSLAFMAEEVATSDSISHHTYDSIASLPLLPSPSSLSLPPSSTPSTLSTISSSLQSLVSRLGENITLRRAATLSLPPVQLGSKSSYFLSTFLHGSTSPALKFGLNNAASFESGRIAGILLFKQTVPSSPSPDEDATPPIPLAKLSRALSRQLVALPTKSISPLSSEAIITGEGEPSPYLLEQSLITLQPSTEFDFEGGSKVGDVLRKWSEASRGGELEVVDMVRWEVGSSE